MGHKGRLDFHGAQTMARHIQDIVDTPHDPEIPVGVALCTVARQVIALVLRREVALLETLGVTPDGTNHGRPRALLDQKAALAGLNLTPRLVDNRRVDTR